MTSPHDLPGFAPRPAARMLSVGLCLLLSACASPALHEADDLALQGQHEQALAVLGAARKKDPADNALRAAEERQRELTISVLANQAEVARGNGQLDAARDQLSRLDALAPRHPRTQGLRAELERDKRQQRLLQEAARALDAGRVPEAQAKVREVLTESPGLPAARAVQRAISDRAAEAAGIPDTLAAVLQKKITVEFRDATLRSVFESIGRTQGVNFVFDKDVRAESKITIFLRDVTLDEAMRVILASQQLDRKLLNDSSLFIYPNTPLKQQEHQELMTRSFYLTNADVKSAQTLVKTMTKTRDLYVDERLNMLIVRDTPEAVRLIERLVASIDLPEPEVMLEVEVMEIGTNRLNQLGLQWPDTIEYGVPNVTGQITSSDRGSLRASIANPAVIATLKGTSGSTNMIANPKLRARNHEKAKVQIGERLPVFTSTSVINIGQATTVTYVETGLKLEVEPSVQLDNDVVIKVNLEVVNLIGQVTGPDGSIAYRVGTRNATTSLRLRDGETQILAGLISDEDTKAIQGVPGASELPVVGRLFGVHSDTLNKSEVVLLITPRVVRNIGLPDADMLTGPAGNYTYPGAASTRLRSTGKIAMSMSTGAPDPGGATPATGTKDGAPEEMVAVVEVSTSGQALVGETVSITVQNKSTSSVHGQLGFDSTLLQSASADKADRVNFDLDPSGQKVIVLRVLPGAAGKSSQIQLDGLTATSASGAPSSVKVEGDTELTFTTR